ncbi:thioredoxin-like protein [Apiosordaria backusii]|uniref:Thioredoxin-like protein n=1 Tax=Apiosordaria backusii TaxID=314023 RepID=A0AA40EZZ7_9PEZI|nr:thioredoxin-like protein [Apiosordaria backusii]
MGGKIDCYLDIASLYSYLAYLDLLRNRPILASHGVTVEFHPTFLGALNQQTGNKPPWALPAKAAHGPFDAQRSIARQNSYPNGAPLNITFPENLFVNGKTILPLRALHCIKSSYSPAVFDQTLLYLLHIFWSPPNLNLTEPANLKSTLLAIPEGFAGPTVGDGSKKRLFTAEQVEDIMKGAQAEEFKEKLKNTTAEALERGAFGAPWIWATNDKGEGEPFFGSDRFHFVYKFLGLPYRDVELLPNEDDPTWGKLWRKGKGSKL